MPEPPPIGYFARGPRHLIFTDRKTGDVAQVEFEGGDNNIRVKIGDQSILFNPVDAERLALCLIRFTMTVRCISDPVFEAANRVFYNRVEERLQATESDDQCFGDEWEVDD